MTNVKNEESKYLKWTPENKILDIYRTFYNRTGNSYDDINVEVRC